jgi:DNA-directed RNA polymerase subunit M/transcription elongation factor TFIIS
MYYIGINEKNSNQLVHYCRSCGHKDDSVVSENSCILKTQIKKGTQKFNHIINKYTKLDPTLPRIYNVNCPNSACSTNQSAAIKPEIIYIRYDDDNMKYLYMCVECDHVWKTDDMK